MLALAIAMQALILLGHSYASSKEDNIRAC
jgi:hypothetical protein